MLRVEEAMDQIGESAIQHFKIVSDVRVESRCRHNLLDVIVISLCAVLCGAESWSEIEEFGLQRVEWLKKFLKLNNGVPSHDTIRRLFILINPKEFERAFFSWARTVSKSTFRHVCLDGKSIKGTAKGNINGTSLHLVNMYNTDDGIVLGQSKASSPGFGEADAVLECLEMFNLKGSLVTVDAGLSTKRVVEKIDNVKADYLVPIKGNQKPILEELVHVFSNLKNNVGEAVVQEKSHGRIDTRTSIVVDAKNLPEEIRNRWPRMKTAIRVERTREEDDKRALIQKTGADGKQTYTRQTEKKRKQSHHTVYYLSSRKMSAEECLYYTRKHWEIENGLHWSLDVVFKEDDWLGREKVAARNLALVRKAAFNIIQKNKDKGSKRIKMKRASWNLDYLEKLIFANDAV